MKTETTESKGKSLDPKPARDITNHKYYKQGWQAAWDVCERNMKQSAFEDGKKAGIEEAAKKYRLQDTMIKTMETQAMGMEMLTRLSSAIVQLTGKAGVM